MGGKIRMTERKFCVGRNVRVEEKEKEKDRERESEREMPEKSTE